MPYIIVLNDLRGVEMIIRSLRDQGDPVSFDLASGIEYHTIYQDEKGKLTKLGETKAPEEPIAPKAKPKLRLV